MLGLAVLGYSPFLSITFGAIGGIASGMIAAWLKPKDAYEPTKAEQQAKAETEGQEEPVAKPAPQPRFRKYGTSTARRQHQSRGRRHFGWFFRRK
jgi:hypothetical protein